MIRKCFELHEKSQRFFFNLKEDSGIKPYICNINTYFLAPPGALLGFVVFWGYMFIIVLFWIPRVLLHLLLWCQLDTSGTALWMPLSVDLKSAASEITNILARWESYNSKYFAWFSKVYCSFITCALVLNCFVFLIACLGYWTCWWTESHGDFSWRKTAMFGPKGLILKSSRIVVLARWIWQEIHAEFRRHLLTG